VGFALQKAMRKIEKSNPETLYGIFGDAPWTNKARLSDALIRDLIEHFSSLPLGNKDAPPDVLGQAYEYLIKKFADATNKKAGEFYTPRSVVRLMIDILHPRAGETIYDPACGTGGMLLGAIQHVKEIGNHVNLLWGKLYGQEKNLTTSNIARINLLLHGVEDFHIARGDTLRQPAFYSGDLLANFDCVIANPPFSLQKWGREIWENDPYGRPFAGLPNDSNGDFAWLQHMIKSMDPIKGRMAVVLPHGALFRAGREGKIRRKILEKDILEAVIGLGPNLFYGAGIPASILVFRSRKPKEKQNQVLIIDASEQYQKGKGQNIFTAHHRKQVFSWYQDFQDVKGFARVVAMSEIAGNDWNLNIPRYIEPLIEEEAITLAEAINNLQSAMEEAFSAEDRLKALLIENGLMTEMEDSHD
jgi:type I restriction enzyme M protein